MGIMAYSLLWVMQDLYHPPYLVFVVLPYAFLQILVYKRKNRAKKGSFWVDCEAP